MSVRVVFVDVRVVWVLAEVGGLCWVWFGVVVCVGFVVGVGVWFFWVVLVGLFWLFVGGGVLWCFVFVVWCFGCVGGWCAVVWVCNIRSAGRS
ncbi:hypothetical protein RA262_27945, partial [Pseudomonas syringae pv. tagetis]